MAKQSGLGDNFYWVGRNLSGDVNALGTIGGGPAPLEMTAVDKSAFERVGGLRNGTMEFTTFFNVASNQAHAALGFLPTTARVLTYCRGTTLGDPAACMTARQINYDPTRGTDGSLMFAVQAQSDGYGLEWGIQLTAGVRTDTAATNGTGVDTTASASFGGQAYLQGFGFTGTDVTVKIQDSADNVSFTDVTSFAFTQITSSQNAERIAIGNTATIRRYVRAITTTSAGFTSFAFSVVLVKNDLAGQVF